jgi:HEPN domain-containing protein
MSDLVDEWTAKAEEDYSVAGGLVRRRKVPANSVCFHCQQAAEKYLKAVLQRNGIRFGKTHDLEHLRQQLGNRAQELALLSEDLKLLSDYAVKYRYPGQDATRLEARRAVRAATRIRAAIRGVLKAR